MKRLIPIVLVYLLATCNASLSYANDEYQLTSHAATGNNAPQERKKLPVSVEHRTIADVFLCLSFASLPVMGELRLTLAITLLWWGGGGNKPFIRRILPAVLQRFLTLPATLYLGQIIKASLPVRKVL